LEKVAPEDQLAGKLVRFVWLLSSLVPPFEVSRNETAPAVVGFRTAIQ
jgi:hypothetical protein